MTDGNRSREGESAAALLVLFGCLAYLFYLPIKGSSRGVLALGVVAIVGLSRRLPSGS